MILSALTSLLSAADKVPDLPGGLLVGAFLLAAAFNAAKDGLAARLGIRSDQGVSARDVRRSGFVMARSGRRLPRVEEAMALECGVHRAAQVTEAGSEASPTRSNYLTELPPYVLRDGDVELDEKLRSGGLVVITGDSAAGKTRAAFEAMRRVMPRYKLLVPQERDARVLHALADLGRPLRRTVVWLDDLERYLGPDGISERTLDVLGPPGRSDVVFLATVRPEALRVVQSIDPGEDGRTSPGRVEAVMRRAREIRLAPRFSEAERDRARKRSDPRLTAALDHEAAGKAGVPEYLAAGPAVLRRWFSGRDGEHRFAAALIGAAVNCRRIGYHRPVPAEVLARLVPYHMDRPPADPDGEAGRDTLVRDGFRWATEPVLGASGCLAEQPNDTYLAFDYLVDQVQRDIDAPAVPVEVWDAVLLLLSDSDPALLAVAATASSQGHSDRATGAWRRAAEAGSAVAMYYTAVLAENRGAVDEASRWYRSADLTDDPVVLRELGDWADKAGDSAWAIHWWTRAAEAGDREAMYRLALLWKKRASVRFPLTPRPGATEMALLWLRRAADAGHPAATYRMFVYLTKTDRPDEAASWLRRAEGVDEPAALLDIGRAARDAKDHDNAVRWLERAAGYGDSEAMLALAATYHDRHESPWREAGDLDAAERWYRAAGDAGQRIAMFNLAGLLTERGDEAGAKVWLTRCARLGDHGAMWNLGFIAKQRDDLGTAKRWWERAATRGSQQALIRLADLADQRGDLAESERLDRQLTGRRHDDIDRDGLRDLRELMKLKLGWRRLAGGGVHRPPLLGAPVLVGGPRSAKVLPPPYPSHGERIPAGGRLS